MLDADVVVVLAVVEVSVAAFVEVAVAIETMMSMAVRARVSAVSVVGRTVMNGRLLFQLLLIVIVILHILMEPIVHVVDLALMIRRASCLWTATRLRKVCSPLCQTPLRMN